MTTPTKKPAPPAVAPSIPRDFDAYFTANRGRIEKELFDFLRIPRVSAPCSPC